MRNPGVETGMYVAIKVGGMRIVVSRQPGQQPRTESIIHLQIALSPKSTDELEFFRKHPAIGPSALHLMPT